MSISFQCTSCDADFDLEIPRIIDRPTALKCPNCNARPPAHRAHALGTAIEDLLSAMAAIRTKMRFEVSLDTEELPPPYGPAEEPGEGLTDLADDLDEEAEDADEDEDEDKDEDEDEDEDKDDFDDEDEDDDEEESEEGDDDFDYDDDDDDDDDDDEEEEEEEED